VSDKDDPDSSILTSVEESRDVRPSQLDYLLNEPPQSHDQGVLLRYPLRSSGSLGRIMYYHLMPSPDLVIPKDHLFSVTLSLNPFKVKVRIKIVSVKYNPDYVHYAIYQGDECIGEITISAKGANISSFCGGTMISDNIEELLIGLEGELTFFKTHSQARIAGEALREVYLGAVDIIKEAFLRFREILDKSMDERRRSDYTKRPKKGRGRKFR
jgi:hypothetical protein